MEPEALDWDSVALEPDLAAEAARVARACGLWVQGHDPTEAMQRAEDETAGHWRRRKTLPTVRDVADRAHWAAADVYAACPWVHPDRIWTWVQNGLHPTPPGLTVTPPRAGLPADLDTWTNHVLALVAAITQVQPGEPGYEELSAAYRGNGW
jgi:hypothetical protein